MDQGYDCFRLFGLLSVATTLYRAELGPLMAAWAGCGSQGQCAHAQLTTLVLSLT